MASGDLSKITNRQQEIWSTGDFHRIGVAQVVVGGKLVRSLHVHAGERVLDVAGGAGNAALAVARRGADVICTDYVPELLQRAQRRAEAEGLPLHTEVADAQQLPFGDGTFDVVLSTFGAMFAPDQARTASELLRVLGDGGRLGMANWTPQSWVGSLFGLSAKFLAPPPGLVAPSAWRTEERLRELFGDRLSALEIRRGMRTFVTPIRLPCSSYFVTGSGRSQRYGRRSANRSGSSTEKRSPTNSTLRGTGPARSCPSTWKSSR